MARINLNEIIIDTFSADTDASPRGQILFLNGFPGAIGPLPAVIESIGRGFDVIAPQYPGTYDSEGQHGIVNTARALSDVLAWSIGRSQNYPRHDLLVIAHSFGAFHLINAMRYHPCSEISKILLLAPVMSYSQDPDYGVREDLMEQVEYVVSTRRHTYRIGHLSEWQQAAGGIPFFELEESWKGTAYVAFGTADDTFDVNVFPTRVAETLKNLIGCEDVRLETVKNSGHGMHELLPKLAFLDAFFE